MFCQSEHQSSACLTLLSMHRNSVSLCVDALHDYSLAREHVDMCAQLLSLREEAPMMLVNRAPNDTDAQLPGAAIAQLTTSGALSSAPADTGQVSNQY